jgi:adenine phosphoribosyltransferase
MNLDEALSLIRPIPDYPKPGILFQDVTPLLSNGQAFAAVTQRLQKYVQPGSVIAGIEARGFIFASALANHVESGFVPIRKAGKLPFTTISQNYGLEYGNDTLEIHTDALIENSHVLLIDDVLATGGTIDAAIDLVQRLGATVYCVAVLLEIESLGGRLRLTTKYPELTITSLVVS